MAKSVNKIEENFGVLTKKDAKNKLKKPSLYKVVMLNDDYTPMDFVVYLLKMLKNFFQKNDNEASKIMLEVHNKGAGICGVFTYEIAESKILKVINLSRKNGFPLLLTIEKI